MPRVAAGLQVPHPRDRDWLLPALPLTSRRLRISPMKPDMQRATCALNLWLLAHEDLVAIEVFTLHPRAPRARTHQASRLPRDAQVCTHAPSSRNTSHDPEAISEEGAPCISRSAPAPHICSLAAPMPTTRVAGDNCLFARHPPAIGKFQIEFTPSHGRTSGQRLPHLPKCPPILMVACPGELLRRN